MASKHPSIEPLRRAARSLLSGAIRLVVTLAIIVGVMVACLGDQGGSSNPNITSAAGCGDAEMAHIMSRHFVKPKLLSPASAKFPGYHDREVSVTPGAECEFTVYGYVDSQNPFGAMIRTRYTAHMRTDKSTGRWQAKSVEML